MATFAIFNYQFEKIVEDARQGELEGMESVLMSADEAFPQKQKILGEILNRDFKKEKAIDVIHFTNGHGPKEYIHRHLMPPTDDIVIMRVANRKTQTIVDAELREKRVDDYQNCIVMIDNRSGIQRILIENKKTAFRDVKSLANILEYTFNCLLRQYSLVISLDHLQDSRKFWQYANDRRTYPMGFYRICFKLPYPNLERLRKVYDRLFSQAQKSFNSRLDMDFTNPNGEVRLEENDPYQNEAIKWFMEDAGGDVILYSNMAKNSPIVVGKNSFRAITVSNTTIQRVTEDAVNNDLFGSAAFDEVKQKLKTGIEP
jgi:hypothetical protein